MDYLVLVERPYTEAGTEQEWVSIITDPHAAVRAVMDPGAKPTASWQILTAVAERGSCRLPQNP